MFRKCKDLGLVFALLVCVLANSGCFLILGAAAGAGGLAYIKGILEKNFDYPIKKMDKASVEGLKDLGFFVTQDELNLHSATIKAEDDEGKSITVEIEALTEKSSKLKIRVGVFGDESKSQMILNAIQARL